MSADVKRAGLAVALLAVSAVVLLSALGRAGLFNPDEPREAELAREMWASGDLLVPRLNGEAFLEKPPLFYWIVSGLYRLAGGPGEIAARVAPACAGILCVLLTYLFGRRMVGERASALGALALLTSFQFFWIARRCLIDVPLALAVLLACGAFYRGAAAAGRRRALWLLAGYLATALAVLLKGVIGAAIPALALAGFIVLRRDWRGVLRLGLLPGAVVALLPAALWALALYRGPGPGAAREFVWVNNVMRFVGGAGKGHENPLYYYLPTLAFDFAPWSLVLPFALAAAWSAVRARRDPALQYLLCWFALPLLVLSIASTKRGIYLLPIYPAAALLVGRWLAPPDATAGEARHPGSRLGGTLLLGGAIVTSAGLLAALILARPADRAAPAALALLVVPAGVAGYRALRERRLDRLGGVVGGVCAVLCLAAAVLVVPPLVARDATAREAGRFVRRLLDAGDRVVLFRIKEGALGGYLFYAGATLPALESPEDLRRALEIAPAGGRVPATLALMQEETYRAAAASLGTGIAVVRRFAPDLPPALRLADRAVVLIAARGPSVATLDPGVQRKASR